MRTRTLLSIVSLMIFGAALLMGIAVIGILMVGGWFNLASPTGAANIVNETYSVNTENTGYFVYLASDHDRSLVRVSSDGTSQTLSLGLSENTLSMGNFAISPDGRLAAFCPIERISDQQIARTFIVRDIEAATNLVEIPYGNIPGCNAEAFSPDGSTVALSIVFNSAVENYYGNRDEADWTLRLFDAHSGAVVREMSANSAFAPNFAAISDAWFDSRLPTMNRVLYYGSSEILFVAFPFYGGDGPLEVPGFRWDFASNTVTEIANMGRFGADYLPSTGELVYPMMDNSLPFAQPMGPMPTANTLQISDNNGTHTIYRNTGWIIARANFINGGRQIAVLLVPGFDPEADNPGAQGNRIELINRDGTVQVLGSEFVGMSQLYGTASGFTFQWTDFLDNPPTFHIERYDGQSIQSIWSFTPNLNYQDNDWSNYWLNIVWASPMTGVSGLAPFQAAN